ncbi:MAG: 5-oxoprolinase subunit PxpB [Chloroflexi bacterium]|nr:5-oxoprolinase subunit PxpB [Chloroflexota bacterium]
MVRYLALGDGAITVEFGREISPSINAQVRSFHQALLANPPAGLLDVIPTYRSITVQFDPLRPEADTFEDALRSIDERAQAVELSAGQLHTLPVHYGGEDGPDLEEVAQLHGLTIDEVIALHARREYLVYCLGFSPGFALLGGLPEELATPRLGTPRKHVPAGSVGVGGQQTGVYPVATPGGWRLLGRTSFRFFDVNQDPPSPIRPGDRILFEPVDKLPPGESARDAESVKKTTKPALEVLDPGLMTTVQDLGRWGYQAYGVSVAGPVDDLSFRMANAAAGNPPAAACLECTLAGPTLLARQACTIAVAGAAIEPRVNGHLTARGVPIRLRPGDRLEVGAPRRGLRSYLALGGGIDVPEVLSSRATYTRGCMGGSEGRPLRAGDTLARADAGRQQPRVAPDPPLPWPGKPVTVRVVLGPQDDYFDAGVLREFLSRPFTISSDADRMGYRLSGYRLRHSGPSEIVTDGLVAGSIQVPGHGDPIVMLADRASVGGYPKIATVITADLRIISQCTPGMRLRFEAVGAAEARAILRRLHADLLGDAGDELGSMLGWTGSSA